MNQRIALTCCGALVASACHEGAPPATSHEAGAPSPHAMHGAANEHMHHASFEELVRRFESPERDAWQKPEKVLELLGPLEGKTVADIGAGTGYFAVRLARAGASVIAVDVDPRFLDYIAHRSERDPSATRIQRKLATFEDAGLAPASVDVVLLVDVYHHIEARPAYFRKLTAALRPGGRLVIIDFKKGLLPEGPPDTMKLAPTEVIAELEQAGYGNPSVDTTSLPYQYVVEMTAR